MASNRYPRLSIKGKDTDDAILCTGAQTYALRAVNVSNSFVIATGSLTDGQEEVFIQDEIHEIMEIIPTVPRLERIRAVLRGCEYGRDITSSNSMETDNPPVSFLFARVCILDNNHSGNVIGNAAKVY